jgi:hypothetical protein
LRALLDEQVRQSSLIWSRPRDVRTVADEGSKGLKNGELLQRMREAGFSALVTVDRRMEYQQNIPRSGIGLVVLHASRARTQELSPLAPAIAQALDRIQPGEIIHLYAPPSST